jgi:glycosyltransferase involved in cell wall biosynthesis
LGLQSASSGPLNSIAANVERARAVRKAIGDHCADVVLSLGDRCNVLMLLSTVGLRSRKIISERADPILQPLSTGWNLLRRLAYPMATLHISQSNYASAWIRERFPSLPCLVLGNAGELDPDGTGREASSHDSTGVRLIAVGRLTRQKGFDLLLAAMAMAGSRTQAPLQLVVAGEGEERQALLARSEELALNVRFLGRVTDVRRALLDADIFVMPSRWEGFPNAMVEAMTLGLPVIAARCKGGMEDVLNGSADPCALDFPPGDVTALADQIVRLAGDAELRSRLGSQGRLRAADYSPARVAAAWCEVVEA